MKASLDGVLIAESDDVILMEGNMYFPKTTIKEGILQKSDTPYTYPWKGVASYWHLDINGEIIEDGAWSYDNPSEAAMSIKKHISFNKTKVNVIDE